MSKVAAAVSAELGGPWQISLATTTIPITTTQITPGRTVLESIRGLAASFEFFLESNKPQRYEHPNAF